MQTLALQQEEQQPFLFSEFSDEVVSEIALGERQGRYTAERLKEQRPDIYDAIVRLRGREWGQLEVARTLHVHHRTVAAVDRLEAPSIDIQRQRLITDLRNAGHLQVERLQLHPELVPYQVAAMAAKSLLEQADAMEGRVGSVQLHIHRDDIFGDWHELVAKLASEKDEGGEKSLGHGNVSEVALELDDPMPGGFTTVPGSPDPETMLAATLATDADLVDPGTGLVPGGIAALGAAPSAVPVADPVAGQPVPGAWPGRRPSDAEAAAPTRETDPEGTLEGTPRPSIAPAHAPAALAPAHAQAGGGSPAAPRPGAQNGTSPDKILEP